MRPSHILLLAAFSAAPACASTPRARPHDMSALDHEAEARRHESEAREHAAQIDPHAPQEDVACRRASQTGGPPCWSSLFDPSGSQAEAAAEHRRMAAAHRAASRALRAAEAAACAGLSEADRDTSPFDHPGDVARVDELYSPEGAGGKAPRKLVGASVTVRAVPGLTREYLQRLVDCHVARNAAVGFDLAEMASCPLSVKGVSAKVESAGAAFEVKVRAAEPAAAREIARRAKAIAVAK